MDNQNLDELIRAGRNIQALALIREQFGCDLREAIDLLSEHHSRLTAEREPFSHGTRRLISPDPSTE